MGKTSKLLIMQIIISIVCIQDIRLPIDCRQSWQTIFSLCMQIHYFSRLKLIKGIIRMCDILMENLYGWFNYPSLRSR